jgi:hypothetical protein
MEGGLVNGTIDAVHDIARAPSVENPREQPPSALLVHFDQYSRSEPAPCEGEGIKLVSWQQQI